METAVLKKNLQVFSVPMCFVAVQERGVRVVSKLPWPQTPFFVQKHVGFGQKHVDFATSLGLHLPVGAPCA